ncbi:MAG TPA: D-alanyl-D-alanine carboxypeptidase [Solirubrobacteraceae bacterium]
MNRPEGPPVGSWGRPARVCRPAVLVPLLLATAILLTSCGGRGRESSSSPATTPKHAAFTGLRHGTRARLLSTPRPSTGPQAPQDTPALTQLRARLNAALRHQGRNVGVLVTDLTTGATLYSREPNVARPPASVEKLYTSLAVLTMLGPNARLHTHVLGTGHMGPGGVWHGNLYLRGDGDPTFGDGYFNRVAEDGYGPTAADLVAQLAKRRIHRVTGHVFGDESLFDADRGGPLTHNRPDTPDYGGELSALVYDHGASARGYPPPVFAARELVITMHGRQIAARLGRRTARTPPDARVLATVASPRMSVLVRLMNVPSDDLFADLLAKQIGADFFGEGTLAAGALEIRQAIADQYNITPTIWDGSGLDKADRSSPAQIVELLSKVSGTRVGHVLASALPVVGMTGTVEPIGVHTPAQGHCFAKTGTLDKVTNLAGYCDARGGHRIAFALMVDGPENWQALAAFTPAVGAIAGY